MVIKFNFVCIFATRFFLLLGDEITQPREPRYGFPGGGSGPGTPAYFTPMIKVIKKNKKSECAR